MKDAKRVYFSWKGKAFLNLKEKCVLSPQCGLFSRHKFIVMFLFLFTGNKINNRRTYMYLFLINFVKV